ncbi:MAG: hypothetical protein IT210_18855 [Armatimonadetes bacterium]|nr:hypothetical protein [Armatimonadota bacterium]
MCYWLSDNFLLWKKNDSPFQTTRSDVREAALCAGRRTGSVRARRERVCLSSRLIPFSRPFFGGRLLKQRFLHPTTGAGRDRAEAVPSPAVPSAPRCGGC